MTTLRELYKDHFRIGVACERINERSNNHEIGNPDKEKLMAEQFNSMTFANELKPMFNMAFKSPEAKEDHLPFAINPAAKAMLDWAKENGMPVRGHVLVWHSQCPKEVFCKGYEAVTIPSDPELLAKNPMMKFFEPLDPVCFTDRETMLARLKSYIFSAMDYLYGNGYAETIYAWDVVNEAIEPADKQPTGLRNSYWYRVIGDDFIYWAFRFAKDAVLAASEKYGIKAQPKLFYNDYNEWIPEKKAFIIEALGRSTDEHGSVFSEKLIDGIGMQGHLSDNNDLDEYMKALYEYGKLVSEVQITELDVKCTCTNANQEYFQAVFYKDLFERLIKAKKDGINVTVVTFWGLTDDNSWIRGANPLLFRKDLSCKRSYDALVYAVNGGDLGEPEKILCNLSDRLYDFPALENGDAPDPEAFGFKFRGFGEMKLQSETVHSGKWAIGNERRFGDWCGITFDASDYIGQTIEIGAWVLTAAAEVMITADFGGEFTSVASAAGTGEWMHIGGQVKIPADLHSAILLFQVKEAEGTISPLFVDDVTVKHLYQEESFESEKHIAAIRGAGHLPFITVVDTESVDGKGHSLFVTRQEKDATVKFGISSFIGKKAKVTAFVKTEDAVIRMGLDGAVPKQLTEVNVVKGGWTEITAVAELPEELNSAEIYIETDGRADFFVDDIKVVLV